MRRFEEREGIRRDKEKVKPNPGLKTTAKLMLNSFWGKFSQRENLPTVEEGNWQTIPKVPNLYFKGLHLPNKSKRTG